MRVPVMTMPESSRHHELERQVLERLKWLRFGALERGVQALLKSEGFREVTIVGNMHWRGRSRFGGFDLRARLPLSNSQKLALIQVKQPKDGLRVQRRFVHELRGAMLDWGSTYGVIVTTGQFAAEAKTVVKRYQVMPVRLIDGQQLAKLMVKHCLGVRVKPLPMNSLPELVIDDLFFERLEELGQ